MNRKFFSLIFIWLLITIPGYAQGPAVMDLNANFFIALIAGILLAFGFQALLTLLSVAAGINIAGPFNKSSSKPKNKEDKDNKSKQSSSSSSIGPKISSAVGAWTLITVSISLFLASWLGVKLSLVGNNTIGIVLGLVIWATFYTIMMYLEMKSISSLTGGLFNLAFGVIRSSFDTIKSMVSSSQQTKIQHTIDHSIDKIREEVNEEWNTDQIIEKLDEYVDQLQPEPLDYDRIEQELKNVIDEIEVNHRTELGDNGLDEKTFINIAERQPNLSKEDVQKVGGIFNKIKSANKQGSTKKEKVAAGLDKVTPGSEEQTAQYRQKIAAYLKNTNADEVQPEKLEHDLEEILNNPKSSKEVVLNRVNQIDRETLVELLKGSEKVDDAKARNIVNKTESALNRLRAFLQSVPAEAQQKAESTRSDQDQKQGEYQEKAQAKKIGYEMKLRTFFNSMQRPEFNYERMKLDFIRMFKNPKVAPSILKRRFQEYDRDSIITLLSKKKNVSRQDAENIFKKYDEARNQVIRKAEEVENQVKEKYHRTRQGTLNQFEAARKTAAAAAWRLVGTAVVSGGAAILGGILAIS